MYSIDLSGTSLVIAADELPLVSCIVSDAYHIHMVILSVPGVVKLQPCMQHPTR